ncbi:hypothetical protein FACS1894216_11240 [Synergistales bacterium]|nr:hypothetical protein FACS1894216_11240 [Synergistales bacterium]
MTRRIDTRTSQDVRFGQFMEFDRFCDGRGFGYALKTEELAQTLGISPASLRKQASEGKTGARSNLPKPIKRGRAVVYTRDSIKAWLASFEKGGAEL